MMRTPHFSSTLSFIITHSMPRFPWDPEPVSPDEVKIDVKAATLPEGTPCQTDNSDHEIIVVGCPKEISLPPICVYTGKAEGTRHVFELPVAPSKPAPG